MYSLLSVEALDVNVQGVNSVEWFEHEFETGALAGSGVLDFQACGALVNNSGAMAQLTLTFEFGPNGTQDLSFLVPPTTETYLAAWSLSQRITYGRNDQHHGHSVLTLSVGGPGTAAWNLPGGALLPAQTLGPVGLTLDPSVAHELCWMAHFDRDDPGLQLRVRGRTLEQKS